MSVLKVVIVNYRSADLAQKCIDSLPRECVYEVVIVDNSEDGVEVARLQALRSRSNVSIVEMAENVGFGAAVNRGVRYINPNESDVIWILNPDTTVEEGSSVLPCVELLQKGAFDLLSPIIVHDDHPPTIWFAGGSINTKAGRVEHHKIREVYEPPGWSSAPTGFLTGAGVMCMGATWLRLGGFREDLFMYWEDVDLSLRALKEGLRLGLASTCVLRHKVGASSSEAGMSELFYYYNARNRVYVVRDTFGSARLCHPLAIVETLRGLLRPVRRERGTGSNSKLLASFRGTLAGLASVRASVRARSA
ncbi:glycosyltransferase family 2 protein [Actinomycetospora sp. NBC_00405]|uniref:glycosyltransferase family 2 protein n=1 Tax=Actinomycetospora sp. NBC_00405 TaxID=2975952 RepID=UPI002E1CD4A6